MKIKESPAGGSVVFVKFFTIAISLRRQFTLKMRIVQTFFPYLELSNGCREKEIQFQTWMRRIIYEKILLSEDIYFIR